jgi:thiosulfate/3-mercaptopyruvate sulfurtransferase
VNKLTFANRRGGWLIILALVLGLLVVACGSAAEQGAVTDTAVSPPDLADAVVSTDWLAAHLDDPAVRVIEVSVVPGLYERGHIPGATNFVWHTDFVDTVRRDIVSAERLQELARAAGIDDDSTIVLYGDNNNWFAAWGAWIFKLYGAENVRLLDGGRALWEAEGRELSTRAPNHALGGFTAQPAVSELRALLPDVLSVVEGEREAVILDIRSPAEFEGTIFAPEGFQELAIRAGHIPGAVNVPWSQAVGEDGKLKSVAELRDLYAAVGIDGSQPIIVYCRIGERASHTWYVLTQVLGYEASMYDGSWTEWGNTVGVPIANPAQTVWGAQ